MPDVFRQSDCEILLEAFGHNKKEKGKSGPEGSSSLISITKMRNVLAPFVLRRLKKDVLNQLVDKTLKTVRLEVTTSQRDLYFGIMQSYALKKARAKEQDEDQGFIVDGVHIANILANNSRRLEGEGKEQNKRDELIDLSRDELDTVLKRELTASEANHLFTALRKAANHPLLLRVRYDNDALAQIANVSFQMGHFGRQCDLKMVTNELESFSDFDLHQICGQYDTYLGHKILDESCLYDSPKMVWLRENIPILMAKVRN
jgi:SWI/SNF-related matrix-associated actin-dependent regulator 1 of chromatin subfamily A